MGLSMGRLLAFIVICAVFLVFVVLNLGHSSDISLGFRTFSEIPVFLTAFASFVVGMLFAVPFALSFGRRRKKTPAPDISGDVPIVSPPKLTGSKKKKDSAAMDKTEKGPPLPAAAELKPDEVKKENSPYGID